MKRRGFIKEIAAISATAALPRFSYGQIKGADRIKVGLSGCGSRGCGAVANMLNIDGNVQIVAVADLFQDKIDSAVNRISDFAQKKYGSSAKDIIEPEKVKKFAGWNALDQMLKEDVDVIIEATPPVFRVSHFEKIVAAGKHAFLEKPACIDAVQARKMYMLADEATRKGLSVVTGNQRRYHEGYRDVIKRVQDGAIGELMSAQCYWNSPSGYYGQNFHDDMEKAGLLKGLSPDDMEYQIRN